MSIVITNHGLAQATIVIPQEASCANRFAAEELVKYIRKISGVTLTIFEGRSGVGCPDHAQIHLGPAGMAGAPDASMLKNDGYLLQTIENRLYIIGENDRALLYGVYGFLEEVMGCRFFTYQVEKIPSRSVISVPDLNMIRISPFEFRETSWYATLPGDISYKRGLNGPRHGMDAVVNGIQYWGFAHTMFNYVNPNEYFETHPEYFSMINGVRINGRTQLCLTNPEVLAIVKRKLRQNIIDHPECKIFSLTQMDWYNPCECPECAKVDAEEGCNAGTQLRFVNACAASIAEEFPDVIIDTFAYQYTRQAPKITKPLPNVCIRICSIECCFSHPLATCEETADRYKGIVPKGVSFQKDLRQWHQLHDRMYVWDYTTNYRHYLEPMPNLFVLQPNIRFFIENGVKGLFEQGNGESISGEFGELRAYLLCRLMWNPDLNVCQEINEFLTGYYGLAAGPIRAYIDLIHSYVVDHNVHVGIYDNPTHGHLPNELLDKAEELFDRAEAMAEDETILSRVQKTRLQIRYTRLNRMVPGSEGFDDYCDALLADIKRFGIVRTREWEQLEASAAKMRQGKTDESERWGKTVR